MTDGGVFSNYARYYDLLYGDKDYAAETAFVLRELSRHAPAVSSVLELGCGTGAHGIHMARAGVGVDGIDLSQEMLVAAERRRAAEADEVSARLAFSAGDARTVRTGKIYDAVVSLFHVMSYQNRNEDLRATFQTAASHLAPGGLFLFDYWFGPAVLAQSPEVRVRRLEDESIRVTRIAEPEQRPEENIVDVNYTVLIEDKRTSYTETVAETHSMRYLFLPEILHFAEDLFTVAHSGEWLTGSRLSSSSWAGYSLLVRKE